MADSLLQDAQLVLSPAVKARLGEGQARWVGQLPVELGQPLLRHARQNSPPALTYSLLQQCAERLQALDLDSDEQRASLSLSAFGDSCPVHNSQRHAR